MKILEQMQLDNTLAKNFRSFLEMVFQICRVYTKCIKDGKNKVRSEHQKYPDQEYAEALVRKLFLDGRLVVLVSDADLQRYALRLQLNLSLIYDFYLHRSHPRLILLVPADGKRMLKSICEYTASKQPSIGRKDVFTSKIRDFIGSLFPTLS